MQSLREFGEALRPARSRRSAGSATTSIRGARRARPDSASTCPRSTAAQGLSQTGYCRVFEAFAPDRRDAVGRDGRAPVDRHEGDRAVRHRRAEGALPARPGRRPQARRLRADRARGRLRRLRPRSRARCARADGSWVLNGEKRYIGNGSKGRCVRHLRPRRGGRQGPPHRPDRREGHGRLRGRRALRHHGPARQRPPRASTSTTSGCRPRTCSASPARASRSPCRSSTTGASALGTGSVGAAKLLLDRTIDHVKERRQFDRPLADFELVAGQDRLDGLLPLRARVDVLPDQRPGRRGRARTTRSSRRSARSSGTEFLWYAGQPRAAAARAAPGYMRDRALREGPARHPHLPDLRGRQRRDAGLHRARRAQAAGRGARRAGRTSSLSDPIRLARRAGRLRRAAASSARSGPTGSAWRTRS